MEQIFLEARPVRKLWIRRKAVSTMIGGIIVLGLFLTALVTMFLLIQQNDSYQSTVNKMMQADADRFSENLRPLPPALAKGEDFSFACGSQTCNNYTMSLTNLGIGLQIARIYINSSKSGCTSLCILDPSDPATPLRFRAEDRFLNPGESRNITLWLPGDSPNIILPDDRYGANTITIATTRGRIFTFQWPLPPPGPPGGISAGGPGGTGIYIGPLVITYQRALIAYTTNSSGKIQLPIGGTNGYWSIPPPRLVIYIKIQTDVGTPNDVYLTSQTVFQVAPFNSPGSLTAFFLVAPISLDLCEEFAEKDPTIICDPLYGYWDGGNNGDPNALVAYQPCNLPGITTPGTYNSDDYNDQNCQHRYLIPKPTPEQLLYGERGNPVIVAFAATTAGGNTAQTGVAGLNPGESVTSFLGITYVYNDEVSGTGAYTYAVTLPFIAFCINNPPNNPAMCQG